MLLISIFLSTVEEAYFERRPIALFNGVAQKLKIDHGLEHRLVGVLIRCV